MKLFWQLDTKVQDEVLHHCVNIVMQDMIEDGVKLEPLNDDEITLKEKLEEAMIYVKTLDTIEEKKNYLLGDADISRILFDVGLEMAKGAFYFENNELVIFPDELKVADDEKLLPETTDTKKKISQLN